MEAAAVDYVELGFRSFEIAGGFKGACAYTSDDFIRKLNLPAGLKAGVMMNSSELVKHPLGPVEAVKLMFLPKADSPVSLVRFACHVHEFEATLPACVWLKKMGYTVGINLMQVADRSDEEVEGIAQIASQNPPDALYFSDSLGSMEPEQCAHIVRTLRRHWKGALGIHTHDNLGRAVANTLRAIDEGVTWVDSTVTGMGRGPGNAQTEYVVIELEKYRNPKVNITPLLSLIRKHFQPMKETCRWGINAYYYLAGKYGIHPTYIQEMLTDSRYSEEDILAVINYLKQEGGKKFSHTTLESARNFYSGEPRGSWNPAKLIEGKEVLILGTGPGVVAHRQALEDYIRRCSPFVIALNTQSAIEESLIDIRAACHPVRLLADCAAHVRLPQPLAIPASMLPIDVTDSLAGKKLLDFGLVVQPNGFEFHTHYARLPNSLVIAYALAIATSGKAKRILLAGFDGYGADDPRTTEIQQLFSAYSANAAHVDIVSITPTRYLIPVHSIYGMRASS